MEIYMNFFPRFIAATIGATLSLSMAFASDLNNKYTLNWEKGGCHEHYSTEVGGMFLGLETVESCATACLDNELCETFFIGREDDTSGRSGFCHLYSDQCTNNQDPTWDSYTINRSIPQPAPACEVNLKIPASTGCNGISLTDDNALKSKTANIAVTNGQDGNDIFHFGNGESMTLKNEGCYQFGQEDDEFSISFWFKAGDRIDGFSGNYIMGNRLPFRPSQGLFLHALPYGNDPSTVTMNINSLSNSDASPYHSRSPKFNIGEWVHLVINYESKDNVGKFTIYVNTENSVWPAGPSIFNASEDFTIGGGINPPADKSNFDISELKFYDTKLTEEEVNTLYFSNDKSQLSSALLSTAISQINQHIDGSTSLSNEELVNLTDSFIKGQKFIINDETLIKDTLALIDNFESSYGALFTTTKTRHGFFREDAFDDLTLERSIFRIQQVAHDQIFSESLLNIEACRTLLDNKIYASSNFFPGAAPQPEDPRVSYDINVDASLKAYWGKEIAFATDDSRRPTGKYLAPGSIAKVTVPESMVNAGFSVLVGAHTVDREDKAKVRRFDRVYKAFPIEATETYIANPFGGGIYINVPYLSDAGIQKIQLQNVLQAPFYSTKLEHQTTLEQWQKNRNSAAPWTDFESNNFMMQVPTNWIYKMENPKSMMEGWTAVMDGMTEFKGMVPEQRNRKVLYIQPDISGRHDGSHGIGYPQVNYGYNPDIDRQGMHDDEFLTGPGLNPTMIHELTHAEAIFGFGGSEVESIAYFPAVFIRTQKLGQSLNEAVIKSIGRHSKRGRDESAGNWMVTPNFRNGLEMDRSGRATDETRYQRRGYMKYVDIAALFGWNAITDFYKESNERIESGIEENREGLSKTDYLMLRYSEIAGADLRPLFHFWGRHPEDNDTLQSKMHERGLNVSIRVRERLEYYANVAPKNNAEFGVHHELIYPGKPVNMHDYGLTMYAELAKTYDESYNAKIKSTIQTIINLYY